MSVPCNNIDCSGPQAQCELELQFHLNHSEIVVNATYSWDFTCVLMRDVILLFFFSLLLVLFHCLDMPSIISKQKTKPLTSSNDGQILSRTIVKLEKVRHADQP